MSRPKTPGEVLATHLESKEMSQSKLAEELSVHSTTINKIIKNRRRPSMEMFGEMGVILGPVFALEYIEALNHGDNHHLDATRSEAALREPALSLK